MSLPNPLSQEARDALRIAETLTDISSGKILSLDHMRDQISAALLDWRADGYAAGMVWDAFPKDDIKTPERLRAEAARLRERKA